MENTLLAPSVIIRKDKGRTHTETNLYIDARKKIRI